MDIAAGGLHFTVRGRIFSHSGTARIAAPSPI
jgi:hypothetical protein